MDFNGSVIKFNPEDRTYLVSFDLSSEKLKIRNGLADVVLRYGDTKLNIQGFNIETLDLRTVNQIKIKFLEAIYSYNKSRTGNLREVIQHI